MQLHAFAFSLMLILAAGCGQQQRRDNRRLTQENNELRNRLADTKSPPDAANTIIVPMNTTANTAPATTAMTAAANPRVSTDHSTSDLPNEADSVALLQAKIAALSQANSTQAEQLAEARHNLALYSSFLVKIKASLDKAGIPASDVGNYTDLDQHLDGIFALIANDNSPAMTALRHDLRAALQLPDSATDEDIRKAVDKISVANALAEKASKDLQRQLVESAAMLAAATSQLNEVQTKLDKFSAAMKALEQANLATIAHSLGNFAGIWLAEDKTLPNIEKGCRLFLRVSTNPNYITRALACSGDRVELQTTEVERLELNLGDYDGGIAVAPKGPRMLTSCGPGQISSTADLDNLYFNTATHSGAVAATSAHTTFAGQSLDFISGDADDDLKGVTCYNIKNELAKAVRAANLAATAAAAVNASDALKSSARDAASRVDVLNLSASVCRATVATAGCFTSAGFQVTTSN